MEEKKPSTADILAQIRARKASAASLEAASETVSETPAPANPEIVETTPTSVAVARAIPKIAATSGAKPAIPVAAATPVPATPVITDADQDPTGASRPSIQVMLKAVREGMVGVAAVPTQTTVAKAGALGDAPPMPTKSAIALKSTMPVPGRRGLAAFTSVVSASAICFLLGFITGSNVFFASGALVWAALMTPFAAAWTSIAGVSGIWTFATARFMFPNVLVEPPARFKVGPPSDYPINTVSNKWKDQFGIWIVHTDQYEGKNVIYALTTICTHLGCTPNWLDGEQKFKCPCHGSGFYISGVNFEGPAPRPLERTGLRIAEDGMLEVNKSVKFQEEMGQWTDPTSFVTVV
jgi:cytochrome b6-f complex iron-sulfur subunit